MNDEFYLDKTKNIGIPVDLKFDDLFLCLIGQKKTTYLHSLKRFCHAS